jgi:1,4-alpha-glucan branching enzyme
MPVLKRQPHDSDRVKVTFVLPVSEWVQPVSVLGDFNGWDPLVHPLKRRGNGTRSVSVDVPAGGRYQFKYLADDGIWFCEPDADGLSVNEYLAVNSVLRT